MTDITDDLTIDHHDTDTGGKYVAELKGESATGYLEWEPRGENVRVATHTVVPRAIGGRGVAGELVKRLIADARDQGFKIAPQCSYVAAKFEKNPDWSDLLV